MDIITQFAAGLNNGILTSVSMLVNNTLLFALLLIAVTIAGERRPSKIAKIAVAVIVALLLGLAVKSFFAIERPCIQIALPYCPTDYSFPSLHALAAFTVMMAFLNKRSFWLYYVFALFISFTRLVIEVHTFRDIAGALPMAVIAYYVVDIIWEKYYRKEEKA